MTLACYGSYIERGAEKQVKSEQILTHYLILDIAIAFASMRLPPYVLLEIAEWFFVPTHDGCCQYDIDRIIVGVQQYQNKRWREQNEHRNN